MEELTREERELLEAFKVGPGFISISHLEGEGERFSIDVFNSLHDKELISKEASFTPRWWSVSVKGLHLLNSLK